MRVIVLRMIVTVVAAGIAVGLIIRLSHTSSTLSLCEIAQDPGRYDGRSIKVKGVLYGYSGGVFHLNGAECEPEGNAWATIRFDESFKPGANNQALLTAIGNLTSRSEYIKAEVLITGMFEDLGRRCFAPQFVMEATRLEQVSAASTMPLMVADN
jgi:hypothetical protein